MFSIYVALRQNFSGVIIMPPLRGH